MKNITAFLAVSSLGSFTQAAKKLFLTQPTITKRIMQLEEKLGHKLFKRIGHQVYLTDEGKALLPYAQLIEKNWKNALNKMQDFNSEVLGKLKISCNYHTGLYFLPEILSKYKEQYPKVDLKFNFVDSLLVIDQIINNNAEIGFITLQDNLPKNLHVKRIDTNQVLCVIAKSHPFWRTKGNLIEKLNDIPVIKLGKGNQYHRILHQIIEKYGLSSPEISDINMLETIKKLVEVGLGWSVIYDYMLNDNLKKIPFLDQPVYLDSVCIYRNDIELSKPAKKFIQSLGVCRA